MAESSPAGKPEFSSASAHPGPDVQQVGFGDKAVQVLQQHLALCQELLTVVERENRALGAPPPFHPAEFTELRKGLLPRLNQSYKELEEVRGSWQRMGSTQRQQFPEVPLLLRQAQDIIMKIVLLDRENEQAMLRLGLVSPGQPPSSNRQRPHFVAELYRRTSLG